MKNCHSCHGSGKNTCNSCRGQGSTMRPSFMSAGGMDFSSCNACGGSGKQRCNVCNGQGSSGKSHSLSDSKQNISIEDIQNLFGTGNTNASFGKGNLTSPKSIIRTIIFRGLLRLILVGIMLVILYFILF